MSLVHRFGTYKAAEKFLSSEEDSMLEMQQFLEHFHTSRIVIASHPYTPAPRSENAL
jgi:hypothetical protein